MFECYAEIESAMNEVVQEQFMNGVFLSALRHGDYSLPQIQYFAVQYSYYSRHFPRVLGAAISAMPPLDHWWVPLADNLWDEAGHGIAGRSHEQLYKTFLLSVHPAIQLTTQGLPAQPMSPAVGDAIDTFIHFFQNATPLEAMAAVGLGSELFAGTVMGEIANGLRHQNYNEHRFDLRFWDVHADKHEPRHYQLCKDILIQFRTPQDLSTMFTVGQAIAQSEAQMYTRLHQEMERI